MIAEVNPADLLSGKRVTGAFMGGYAGKRDIPQLVEEYLAGTLVVDEFIDNYITLEQVNQGFDDLLNGRTLRTVVLM